MLIFTSPSFFFYFCFVCLFFWDGRDGLEVELKGFMCFLTSAIENSKARKDKGRKAIWFCNWLSTLVTRRRCLAQGVWRHKPLDTHVGSRANMTRNVKIIWGIFQKINHGDCQLKRLPPASFSMHLLLDWTAFIFWTEKKWICSTSCLKTIFGPAGPMTVGRLATLACLRSGPGSQDFLTQIQIPVKENKGQFSKKDKLRFYHAEIFFLVLSQAWN